MTIEPQSFGIMGRVFHVAVVGLAFVPFILLVVR